MICINNNYEKKYHQIKHDYLIESNEYYGLRAKVSERRYLYNVNNQESILDFGCGVGQNTFLFPKVIGYDISKFSLECCRQKGIKVINSLDEVEDNSFDVVFSRAVLEHLERPLDELKAIKKKLRIGGRLILVLTLENPQKGGKEYDSNQHLYCWNFRTIDNLLIRAGFDIISNDYIYGMAYYKLMFLNKVNFKLCMVALILGNREMRIEVVKK